MNLAIHRLDLERSQKADDDLCSGFRKATWRLSPCNRDQLICDGCEKVISVDRTPVHLADTPLSYRLHPPRLGENTDEILAELDYDAAAVAALRAHSVIG